MPLEPPVCPSLCRGPAARVVQEPGAKEPGARSKQPRSQQPRSKQHVTSCACERAESRRRRIAGNAGISTAPGSDRGP